MTTLFERYPLALSGLCGLLLAGLALYWPAGAPPTAAGPAKQVVWTWGRADDLRFLPPDVVVAAVDTALELRGEQTLTRPGGKSLRLAPGATLLPVVHIDAFSRWHPALSPAQEAQVTEVLYHVLQRHGGSALQVDFEAMPSQRESYSRILLALRARAPQAWLSITALTAWCFQDQAWLASLPVDEVVPTAFRLGPEAVRWRTQLAATPAWPTAACSAQGVATDEPPLKLPPARATYYFSPQPWSVGQWQLAKERLQ